MGKITTEKPVLIVGERHTTHGTPVSNPSWVVVDYEGLRQGFVVFGAQGQGKTAGALYPWLIQLLGHPSRVGCLTLDVKGNFSEQVKQFAHLWGRGDDMTIISMDGRCRFNPIYSETTDITKTSSNIIAAMQLASTTGGSGTSNEQFWIANAEDAIMNAYGMQKILYGFGTLSEIFDICRSVDNKNDNTLDVWDKRLANAAKRGALAEEYVAGYRKWIRAWKAMPDRTRGSIIAQINVALGAFQAYENKYVFCPRPEESTLLGLVDIVNRGRIVSLGINYQTKGNAARLIGALTKLAFNEMMMFRVDARNYRLMENGYEAICLAKDYIEGKIDLPRYAQAAARDLEVLNAKAPASPEWHAAKEKRNTALLALEFAKEDVFGPCEPVMRTANWKLLEAYRKAKDLASRYGGKAHVAAQEAYAEMREGVEVVLEFVEPKPGIMLPHNQTRPVVLCIDEYHEFATAGSVAGDDNFFAVCREAECIPIVATQDKESIVKTMDEHHANLIVTLLQNKLFLKTENPDTHEYGSKLLGEDLFMRPERSIDLDVTDRAFLRPGSPGVLTGKESRVSVSFRPQREAVFPPECFGQLPAFCGLFRGTDGKRPIDPTVIYLPRYWEMLASDLSVGLPNLRSWFHYARERGVVWNGLEVY